MTCHNWYQNQHVSLSAQGTKLIHSIYFLHQTQTFTLTLFLILLLVTLTTALLRYSIILSPTRIDLPLLKPFSTIAKLTGTLCETFSLLIPGILACLTILPLLQPLSLTQLNLVWIFLFHLPINLAKTHPQSGSLHNVQKLSNIRTTTLNNGNYTKLHIPELYLHKLVTYTPKLSIMPNSLLSNSSTIKLLHVKQDLAPSGP